MYIIVMTLDPYFYHQCVGCFEKKGHLASHMTEKVSTNDISTMLEDFRRLTKSLAVPDSIAPAPQRKTVIRYVFCDGCKTHISQDTFFSCENSSLGIVLSWPRAHLVHHVRCQVWWLWCLPGMHTSSELPKLSHPSLLPWRGSRIAWKDRGSCQSWILSP